MCAPCCQFTYIKFRNEGGELDEQVWHELFRLYDKTLPESVSVERRMKMYLNPCRCHCHREGMDAMH